MFFIGSRSEDSARALHEQFLLRGYEKQLPNYRPTANPTGTRIPTVQIYHTRPAVSTANRGTAAGSVSLTMLQTILGQL